VQRNEDSTKANAYKSTPTEKNKTLSHSDTYLKKREVKE
jgi:hypothetical protein